MNILYITNHLNIGGITSYVLTLATGLRKKGHNIYLASSGGQQLPTFLSEGINYIPIPIKTKQEISPGIFLSKLKLSGFIRKNNIDIIHTHSRTTQVLGYLLQKTTGVLHITTCHGFFKPKIFRRIFPCWGKRTIAISQQVKEHLIQDFHVNEKNIEVIHNGIDIEKFTLGTRHQALGKKKLGLGEGPVAGIVARLSDVKGHRYLIEAMKEVLEKVPQAKLLIVGDGKERSELIKLTQTLNLEKNVFFSPEVNDTREVLSAMDLFVMPSIKEGLGLALMEAMAYGLPVVASNIGGIRSLIENNISGILVEPKDVSGLAKAISKLLLDSQECQEFGRQGQKFIRDNFSKERMVLETERLYSGCVKTKD